jgi:hypothetical protein
MRGHRLFVIALSLMLIGACGQARTVTLDGVAGDVLADAAVADVPMSDGPGPDRFVSATSWAVSAGGTGSEVVSGISVDNAGNSYVSGNLVGTASFGSTTKDVGVHDASG